MKTLCCSRNVCWFSLSCYSIAFWMTLIAQWLREHGYETPRGKRFFGQHVYSMIKKHKLREEKLNHKPELEYGPLRFEYVDHTSSY